MDLALQDLEPSFLKIEEANRYRMTQDPIGADGIDFLCPLCYERNGGPVGTHHVICWRPHVSPDISPKPGRWEFVGSGFHDLTLVAGSSSILLMGGCGAHFWIRQGRVTS